MDTLASHSGPPAKWLEILKRVDDEVTGIAHARQIWDGFVSAVQHSQVHEHEPVFAEWVSQLYAHTQAIAIRRMVDDDKRTGSFLELLRRMAGNAKDLEKAPLWWPGSQAVEVDGIRADADRLRSMAAKVGTYATKAVAHAELQSVEEVPTFKDVQGIVDELEGLLTKYTLILTGGYKPHVAPYIQSAWQRVFYEAWLPCPQGIQPQT